MQPINHMVAMCNITSDADLDKSIDDQSKDELGFLARTIDNMIAEMKQLGIQYAADQRQKRKLELEMLQYQINPHFLFNTLGSLRFVAQLNDVPVLEEGISSRPLLLRPSLVKKQELIPISAEIENLRNYFTLQKIRYAGMFEMEYRLEPPDARLRDPALHAPAAGGERHHPRNGGRPVHYHYRGEPVQGHGY